MRATRDDIVIRAVRLALGTALRPAAVGPIDTEVIARAAELDVVDQVILAGRTLGFTDVGEATAAAVARARSLRGTQAESVAWRVHHLLAEARVPSLALKGAALAVMTGRTSGERPGVDTDVLVRPADWPRAHDALVAAGYTSEPSVPTPRRHDSLTRFVAFTYYEARYSGPGGPVDLHWRLVPGHPARLAAARLFARSVEVELAGGKVTTLDPDAMLAHVALHGAKDRWLSLRTLVDAHLLVTVAGATWEGAAALVGSSTAVSHAKAAVASVITGTDALDPDRFRAAPEPESLPSFLRHRAQLTPSVTSVTAVAAGMLLPRQVLARSRLPRPLWWLAILPRLGRALRWCVQGTRVERYSGHARDVARDLGAWYSGTPSRAATYAVVRKVHMRTAGVSSAAMFAAMRALPGAPDRVQRVEVVRARDRSGRAYEELRQFGITVVEPVLDSAQLAQLQEFAAHVPAKLRLVDGRVIDGTYADRPPDTVSVYLPGSFTWANREVQHVMASTRLHDLALARCGLAPVVHTPNLHWSCVPSTPTYDAPREELGRNAQFHVDFDGIHAIRVHMYLTDVDDGTAPMQYVPGSHRVGSLRGRALRFADEGIDERAVTQRFGASAARTITGPAGTTFVSDPRGLHRATAPIDGDRLFLVMAIRGGAFAGAVHRKRAVPVRDEHFGRLLADPRGPLRLFEAIEPDGSSNTATVGVARLASP
jgi:hypothetical protein